MGDDISRKAPGKRDTIVVRSKEQNKSMQRRHFTMDISEVYELFKVEYPDTSVGKPKFASLIPENVLLSRQIPQNICVCRKHENISLFL